MIALNLATGLEINLEELNESDFSNLQLEIRDLREKDIQFLAEKFKIELLDLEDVYDQEERPRVDIDPQNQYIEFVFRLPLDWMIPSDDSDDVELEIEDRKSIPLIGFFKPDSYCLILHYHDKFISEQIKITKKSIKNGIKVSDTNTESTVSALLKLLTGLSYSTEKVIRQYQLAKDDLEKKIFRLKETEGLRDVFQLSKSIVIFENNTKGNLIVLRKLINFTDLPIKSNLITASKFDDLETDFEQFYDQVRIMREIVNSSLDAYGSIVGNNLNEVMKTLTIFTILLSNPILIASLYGMNIGLPFSDHPYAFLIVILVSISLSGIMILYMKRKGIL